MASEESRPLRLRVGEASIALRSNDDELRDWLRVAFHDLVDDAMHAESGETVDHELRLDRNEAGATLTIDGSRAHRSVNVPNVVDHLVSWCNRTTIESRSDHVNIHAAGLVAPIRAGRARCIVVPGEPGAGKSTLAAAALAAGWGYLSDEVISIDDAGIAHPYAKPVTIKPPSLPLLGLDPDQRRLGARQMRWYPTPRELGGTVADPMVPEALVFADYEPEADTELTPMSHTEAALAVAANCQDELDAGGAALLRLARLAMTTTAARLRQRDLRAAVELLADLPAPEPPHHEARVLSPPPPPAGPIRGPRVVDGVVGVILDDGVVVHHPATAVLVALDPLAGVIWQLLDGSTPQLDLARELADAFDHPVDDVAAGVMPLLAHLRVSGLAEG